MSRVCSQGGGSQGSGFLLNGGYTPPTTDGNPPWSCCGWFNPLTLASDGSDEFGVFKVGAGDVEGYRLRIDDGTDVDEYQMTTRNGSSNIGPTSDPDEIIAGEWHAFACRFVATDNHRMTCHTNGSGSDGFLTIRTYNLGTSISGVTSSDRLALGLMNNAGAHFDHMEGKLSTYGLWDVDIGDDAALAFCEGLHPTGIRPDDLHGLYLFDETITDAAAVDHIGGQNIPAVGSGGQSVTHSTDEPPIWMPRPFVINTAVVAGAPTVSLPPWKASLQHLLVR